VPPPTLAQVVFWNDAKTTMEAVLGILRDVFTMAETEATYWMFRVHVRGRAAVRIAEQREATNLADRAVKAARELGMPLRVTVEPVGAPADHRPMARLFNSWRQRVRFTRSR
jgi:ATP-dependent Clp protease adaptor protein ClpS